MTRRTPTTPRLTLFAALLLTCACARAQSGCTNSPENPTALLALVGSSAFLLLRRGLRRSNKP